MTLISTTIFTLCAAFLPHLLSLGTVLPFQGICAECVRILHCCWHWQSLGLTRWYPGQHWTSTMCRYHRQQELKNYRAQRAARREQKREMLAKDPFSASLIELNPRQLAALDVLALHASYPHTPFAEVLKLIEDHQCSVPVRPLWVLVGCLGETDRDQAQELAAHLRCKMKGGVVVVVQRSSNDLRAGAYALHQLHFPGTDEASRAMHICILAPSFFVDHAHKRQQQQRKANVLQKACQRA